MGSTVKWLIVLGLSYGLLVWATNNPESSMLVVEKVGSAFSMSTEFVSELLFDDEERS